MLPWRLIRGGVDSPAAWPAAPSGDCSLPPASSGFCPGPCSISVNCRLTAAAMRASRLAGGSPGPGGSSPSAEEREPMSSCPSRSTDSADGVRSGSIAVSRRLKLTPGLAAFQEGVAWGGAPANRRRGAIAQLETDQPAGRVPQVDVFVRAQQFRNFRVGRIGIEAGLHGKIDGGSGHAPCHDCRSARTAGSGGKHVESIPRKRSPEYPAG